MSLDWQEPWMNCKCQVGWGSHRFGVSPSVMTLRLGMSLLGSLEPAAMKLVLGALTPVRSGDASRPGRVLRLLHTSPFPAPELLPRPPGPLRPCHQGHRP